MRTIPNFTNHPVLQALLDVIEQSTTNHGTYATFSQRVGNLRDVDSRAWVSRIEAALSDQEKLGQLRIARREALLPFIANRASAHKAFRDLVGHRSQICDAIRQGYELPGQTTQNIFELTAEEMVKLGVQPLPTSLAEALDEMERSDLVQRALGEHIFEWFLRNKRNEWRDYKAHVSQWELERYLPSW